MDTRFYVAVTDDFGILTVLQVDSEYGITVEEVAALADSYPYAIYFEFERPAPRIDTNFVCAECGTTEATTYVVTVLDPEDPTTRTEVCRACDNLYINDRSKS